jgi:hypothetical protein
MGTLHPNHYLKKNVIHVVVVVVVVVPFTGTRVVCLTFVKRGLQNCRFQAQTIPYGPKLGLTPFHLFGHSYKKKIWTRVGEASDRIIDFTVHRPGSQIACV